MLASRTYGGLAVALSTLLYAGISWAGQFGVSATVGYTQLAPQYNSEESWSIIPGLRYQEDSWNVNASIPILFQKQDTVTRVGGMMVPSGGMSSSSSGSGPMPGHPGSTTGSTGGTQTEIGDLYFNGEYRLVDEMTVLPAVWITGQAKAPTAASGFGTGQWDYGFGGSLRKSIDQYSVFGDIGYLVTGNSDTQAYNNPVTFGLGGGVTLGRDREWSALVYYQGSSPILEGVSGQSQLSLGANYRVTQNVFLSAVFGKGFSDSTPAYSAYGGGTFYL